MKPRVFTALAGLIGLMVCVMAQSSRGDTVEVVVKYGGATGRINTVTGIHLAFEGEVMPDGPILTFLVNNTHTRWGPYSPELSVARPLARFHGGDLIDLTCVPPKNGAGPVPIVSLKAYKAKPGEDDPHGFVFMETFTHKTGDQTIGVVTLSKYKHQFMFRIPTHPDADGDPVTDDVIQGIADKLRAGELVYAAYTRGEDGATLELLAPWANHFTGTFVKFVPRALIDTDDDTGPAVKLIGPRGKSVTALIPGAWMGRRWVPDYPVVAEARPLKPDAPVAYITADSGDQRTWLVSIQPARAADQPAISQDTQ